MILKITQGQVLFRKRVGLRSAVWRKSDSNTCFLPILFWLLSTIGLIAIRLITKILINNSSL